VNLFYASLSATVFFATVMLFWVFATKSARATGQRFCEVVQRRPEVDAEAPRSRALGRRLFASVHWLRARLGLSDSDELPGRLANAGYRGALAVDLFNAGRIVLPLLGIIAGLMIPFSQMLWVTALPAIGFIAPNIVLTRLIKRRRERIRRSIPDAIDLLVICVDAGLGIDQALLRVGQELGISHPQITEELLQINREQRAGKPRIQAWMDMAKRSQLEDIDSFSAMLLQTERFGTPIARALSGFADGIRLRRRQLAEQLAAKTTVKIIFPLVLFIFPSMFIVILAPAILSIMRGMPDMSH
jgi:tight adherence protein C